MYDVSVHVTRYTLPYLFWYPLQLPQSDPVIVFVFSVFTNMFTSFRFFVFLMLFTMCYIPGPAPCKRGNLGPCPRPWRGATTDRSTTQQLTRFRALPDPGDEGHGVGRGKGGHGRRPASGGRQEGGGQQDADERMPTKLLFRS